MPPISPQGSRGGLITAVVIFVIGFVTATIFAIFYGVQNNKNELLLKNAEDRSKNFIHDTTSPLASYFQDLRQEAPESARADHVRRRCSACE